jgi:hypothetical protein
VGSPATTLRFGGIARIVYGVLALLFPRRMFAASGLGEPDPDVRYFNALFGGRDIVVDSPARRVRPRDGRGPRVQRRRLAELARRPAQARLTRLAPPPAPFILGA